jgi:CDP-paratose 2-epimerase
MGSDPETRPADIPFYVTDSTRVKTATGWAPARSVAMVLDEVLQWLAAERAALEPILG